MTDKRELVENVKNWISIDNDIKELQKVRKQILENNTLYRYLIAFFVYSMAVQTVMLVATYFGEKEIPLFLVLM